MNIPGEERAKMKAGGGGTPLKRVHANAWEKANMEK